MISERNLSNGFSSFWTGVLPNLDSVVRTLNSAAERIETPSASISAPFRRDLISETGFKLFEIWMRQSNIGPEELATAFESAVAELASLPPQGRRVFRNLSHDEAQEVLHVAAKLKNFIQTRLDFDSMKIGPHFRGHGIIGPCYGDVCDHEHLIEIKYVNRSFRSTDFRQCIIYTCLDYFEKKSVFDRIILYNPFLGVFSIVETEELVQGAGGISFTEFASELSYTLTSGELSR